MYVRRIVLAVMLLAVAATSGCFWRRDSYRHPCCPQQPAAMPVTQVPVTAASPCCPCQ
jgi:hypothetical protein